MLTGNMSAALNHTGRDMWLNFHCWNNPPGDVRCAEYGNSFRVYDDHQDTWQSTLRTISFLINRQAYWGPNPARGWPDPDFIFTGGQGCGSTPEPGRRCPGQTEAEYITEFSMWAIAGGHLIFAVEPRNMTAFQRSVLLNKEAIAVFQDTSGFESTAMIGDGSAPPISTQQQQQQRACSVRLVKQLPKRPAGKCIEGVTFGCGALPGGRGAAMWASADCRGTFQCGGAAVVCESWSRGNVTCPCVVTQVWARPLAGGAAAVALFNPQEAPHDLTVRFADIPMRGWGAETQLYVRDLWRHSLVSSATGSFIVPGLPPHATSLLKLTPNRADAASAQ